MKNNFYRPGRIDLEEFRTVVGDLKDSFDEFLSGEYEFDELQGFVEKLIADQDNDGFWGIVNPKETPSEARVDFYYMPTYYSIAILIKFLLDYPENANEMKGFEECLKKGLKASTERGLKGHGYDDISGVIEAMTIFCSAGLPQFIKQYPDISLEFTDMITAIGDFVNKALEEGNTKGMWDEDYRPGFSLIQSYFHETRPID